jgi:hypothetical protein
VNKFRVHRHILFASEGLVLAVTSMAMTLASAKHLLHQLLICDELLQELSGSSDVPFIAFLCSL